MSEEPKDQKATDPKDVKEFLEKMAAENPPEIPAEEAGEGVPLEGLTADDLRSTGGTQTARKEAIYFDPIFDQSKSGIDRRMLYTLNIEDGVEITVTEEDKKQFLAGFLHDDAIEMDIHQIHPMKAGYIQYRFRSMNNAERELVFAAVERDLKLGLCTPDKGLVDLRVQRYCMMQQLIEIDGRKYDFFNGAEHLGLCNVDSAVADYTKVVDKLRVAAENNIARKLSDHIWDHRLMALRQFTVKYGLCLQNIANRSFWAPVG